MFIRDVGEFVDYYGRLRARTRAVVQRVPPHQLEWRDRPGRFSLGDLIRHLAATERWMFAENVQGLPSRYPGCGADWASGYDAVVEYMDDLHRQSLEIISRLTPEDLDRRCPTPGGIQIRTWKWLRALAEHEVHHRGQMYMVLGALGVETPPLYGLTEPQVLANSLEN